MSPLAIALLMPASDWLLFFLTSAMFAFAMWLLVGEVRKWAEHRTEMYGKAPSAIRLLNRIFRRYHERQPSIQTMPSEQANTVPSDQVNNVNVDTTAKKVA